MKKFITSLKNELKSEYNVFVSVVLESIKGNTPVGMNAKSLANCIAAVMLWQRDELFFKVMEGLSRPEISDVEIHGNEEVFCHVQNRSGFGMLRIDDEAEAIIASFHQIGQRAKDYIYYFLGTQLFNRDSQVSKFYLGTLEEAFKKSLDLNLYDVKNSIFAEFNRPYLVIKYKNDVKEDREDSIRQKLASYVSDVALEDAISFTSKLVEISAIHWGKNKLNPDHLDVRKKTKELDGHNGFYQFASVELENEFFGNLSFNKTLKVGEAPKEMIYNNGVVGVYKFLETSYINDRILFEKGLKHSSYICNLFSLQNEEFEQYYRDPKYISMVTEILNEMVPGYELSIHVLPGFSVDIHSSQNFPKHNYIYQL